MAEPIETSSPFFELLKEVAAHVVEFGVLAVLAYRALAAYGTLAGPYLWLAVMAFAAGYAVTDELHQSFVPVRIAGWQDLGYDFLGGVGGLLVAESKLLVRRWR